MRAIIIHGWDGNPQEGWYPWLKEKLMEKGYSVDVPQMPDTDKPTIEKWVGKLKELEPDEETIVVAHSIGCQATMRYLMGNGKIKGALFVGGWVRLKPEAAEDEEDVTVAKPWLEEPIDWKKVRENCGKFICVFSDNDPFVPIEDAEAFMKKLNAKIVIEHGMGHMGGEDDVTEFPQLLELVEEL